MTCFYVHFFLQCYQSLVLAVDEFYIDILLLLLNTPPCRLDYKGSEY